VQFCYLILIVDFGGPTTLVLSGFSIFIILLRVGMGRVVIIFLMNLQNKNVVSQ
jgi:hypothetical protein